VGKSAPDFPVLYVAIPVPEINSFNSSYLRLIKQNNLFVIDTEKNAGGHYPRSVFKTQVNNSCCTIQKNNLLIKS